MNELDKIIELAGIIVGAAGQRDKKDDAGMTINDLPINGEEEAEMPPVGGIEVAQTIPDDHEIAFSVDDQDCDDGYEDLGFAGAAKASPAVDNFKVGEQHEVDEEIQRMQQLAGMQEAGYQSPTVQHIGGGSAQFARDIERFVGILKDKGINDAHSAQTLADKIIKAQGAQSFDGVQAEYVAKAAMAKLGVTESDEEDTDLPPAKTRDAKPEPDYEKEYDKDLNWWGKDDVEEGIEDEDDGEMVDFEADAGEDDDIFSDKPKVRGARPEPDFKKKYDDWYWNGKGEKFAEEDDLSNGYGKEKTFDKDDMFPNGFDTPIQNGKGPASAKHGDNPLARQNKMAVKESIKHSLYQELINFKK